MEQIYNEKISKEDIKRKIITASQIYSYLNRWEPNLKGKKILDIGFGLGFNDDMLKNIGAIVYGCEPNSDDYNFAIEKGFIDREKAYNMKVQDLPEELYGSFDKIFAFLFNIDDDTERFECFDCISKLLKPDGSCTIAFQDDFDSISDELDMFFEDVDCGLDNSFLYGEDTNKHYIYGTKPFVKMKIR